MYIREGDRGGAGGVRAPPNFQILLIEFCQKTSFQKSYKVVHHHSQNANPLPDKHLGFKFGIETIQIESMGPIGAAGDGTMWFSVN